MGVRAIEHTRPALSRVPFLSSHFHQVPRHRDKLYDCSFLRVPPRSTDLWSTIVRYLLPFTPFFLLFFYFSFLFLRFTLELFRTENILCSFLGEVVQGDEFCLMIMRFNCSRYYCIISLFYPFQNRSYDFLERIYEFLIYLFGISFLVYFNFTIPSWFLLLSSIFSVALKAIYPVIV